MNNILYKQFYTLYIYNFIDIKNNELLKTTAF